MNPNEMLQALAAAEVLKKQPIPAGHVRFERNEYHYGQQGQIFRTGYTLRDVPELEAIDWISYGTTSLTWPDGGYEHFDMRVQPVEHSCHAGFGKITRVDGKQYLGTLSRLPNVFVEYYGARAITPDERATFKPETLDY